MRTTVRELSERISEIYPGRLYLSISEAAALIGADRRLIESAINQKRNPMPMTRIGSKRWIPVIGLCEWLVTHTVNCY